jgi:hypothetical protein
MALQSLKSNRWTDRLPTIGVLDASQAITGLNGGGASAAMVIKEKCGFRARKCRLPTGHCSRVPEHRNFAGIRMTNKPQADAHFSECLATSLFCLLY